MACKIPTIPPIARVVVVVVAVVAFLNTVMTSTSTLPRDALALQALKEEVSDPYGTLSVWMGEDPCGERWSYVECSDANVNRTIIQLSLSNLQLGGEIPASFQNLMDLKSLDLGNNNFYGQIPSWIGNLTKLVALDLQSNELSGGIPKELGRLKDLVFLRVTNNSMMGLLPREFGNMSSLKILACEDNFLSGSMPSTLINLRSITHLHMDHNQFTGALPTWLGQFHELVHLIINDNMISGPVPPELGNCVKLRQLKLGNNFITGAIPATLGLLTNLTDLRMHNNSLHGLIPTSFNNLISLQVLDLGFNHLEGSMPTDLGDLEALVFLNLQGNYLSGSVPYSFAELSSIEIINLSDNKLSGPVPNLGLGNNLLSLELEYNFFTGPIPISLRRPGLDLKLYGNPVCVDVMNEAIHACSLNHMHNNGSVPPVCSCPPGMILRPISAENLALIQCDCVLPLVIELFFPRVLFKRCTREKQERLARNLARELYLDVLQVVVTSIAQNGTGTDVTFKVLPLTGISLDNLTLMRIEKKLYAPYLSAVWFDGEFGWFNYVVLQFILPLFEGGSNLAPSQRSSKKKTSSEGGGLIIVGSIVGGIGIVLILIMLVVGWRKYLRGVDIHHIYQSTHNMASSRNAEGSADQVFFSGPSSAISEKPDLSQAKVFRMDEVNIAANNFCSENLISTGGLGAVYRGVLQDGTSVAIKKFSGLTKESKERFENEIEMSGYKLRDSPHLMHLLGYCRAEEQRALIYELMAHGSLLDYLKGAPGDASLLFLEWKTRLQIATDSAKGVRYLHELNPQVIHRDIKPSNILLDENFHAKVADLGLSVVFPITGGSSCITTRVMGTFGYLDPDYSITGKLTAKSDVYSFGVVLLELLTGKNVMFRNDQGTTEWLVHWAKPLLKDKRKRTFVIDEELKGGCPTQAVELMASLILSCLDLDPDRRPNMVTVESMLYVIHDIPT